MNSLAKEDVLSSMEEEHQLSITSSMFLNYDSITIQKEKGQNEADKQSEQSLAIENDQRLNNSLASLPSSSSIGSGIHSLDQLEKFGDWSGSELESESVPQKSDWGDKLIKIFIAKRRALLIDQDEEDIVSYEESDTRILALLLMTRPVQDTFKKYLGKDTSSLQLSVSKQTDLFSRSSCCLSHQIVHKTSL